MYRLKPNPTIGMPGGQEGHQCPYRDPGEPPHPSRRQRACSQPPWPRRVATWLKGHPCSMWLSRGGLRVSTAASTNDSPCEPWPCPLACGAGQGLSLPGCQARPHSRGQVPQWGWHSNTGSQAQAAGMRLMREAGGDLALCAALTSPPPASVTRRQRHPGDGNLTTHNPSQQQRGDSGSRSQVQKPARPWPASALQTMLGVIRPPLHRCQS